MRPQRVVIFAGDLPLRRLLHIALDDPTYKVVRSVATMVEVQDSLKDGVDIVIVDTDTVVRSALSDLASLTPGVAVVALVSGRAPASGTCTATVSRPDVRRRRAALEYFRAELPAALDTVLRSVAGEIDAPGAAPAPASSAPRTANRVPPIDEKKGLRRARKVAAARVDDAARTNGRAPSPPAPVTRAPAVIAIGTSTGGPDALARVIPMLNPRLGLPIVLVQHMPSGFTELLARRLDARTGLAVREANDGDALLPNTALIAPGGRHLEVAYDGDKVVARLTDAPPENSCRPSADVLFRSVAAVYGGRTLTVVLTGMGSDGMLGAREIHAAGGRILAQDEATSVVWGMPGAVTQDGLAHEVVPIDLVADRINRWSAERMVRRPA